jgi:hypothetical protein
MVAVNANLFHNGQGYAFGVQNAQGARTVFNIV